MDDLDSFTCSMYRQTEKVSKVNDMRLIRINELFTKQNRLVPSRNVDIGNLPPCRRSLSTTHPESKQSKCHRRNWRMIIIMSLVSYSGRMQLRSADSVTCSVPRTRTLLGDADRSFCYGRSTSLEVPACADSYRGQAFYLQETAKDTFV